MHTDADLQEPDNVRMVNMTFVGQCASDIGSGLEFGWGIENESLSASGCSI